jgi:hypothetical protein
MQFIQETASIFLVLILPGLAIQAWAKHEGQDFAEQLASCIGLSISITALLFLLTFYFQFQISNALLTVFYLLCGLMCIAGWLHHKIKPRWSREIPTTLGLLAVVLVLRFVQIEDLLLPAWVDSVHHVLITRLITETRSIPLSLEPYLPVPFSYYFGFHGIAALFSMISGLAPEKAVLILGQVLNACVPLAIYRLGRALWEQREKALIAALLVAFVSQMPAYYVTWGRYTLLTGMIILPITLAYFIEITNPPSRKGALVMLGLLFIGMILSHYFTGVLFGLFALIHLVLLLVQREGNTIRRILSAAAPLAAALVVLALWLLRAIRFSGYSLEASLEIPVTQAGWLAIREYGLYLIKLSGPLRNQLFLMLGFFGIIPLFRDARARSLAAWAILLLMLSLPVGIDLPHIRPDHMLIVLFLPASLSTGNLLVSIYSALRSGFPAKRTLQVVFGILLAGYMIFGIIETRSILNPSTIFVTQSDLDAIEWVKKNLAGDARILTNATHWQSNVSRGVDGGYWLTPLAGIFTLPPPIVFNWGDPTYAGQLNALSNQVTSLTTCDATFEQVLADGQITHIYIRDGVGSLQSAELLSCTQLERIYHHEDVSIFSVKR